MIAVYRVKSNENGPLTRRQIATTPVDMRTRCNPMIGGENIGCFVSSVRTTHLTNKHTTFWGLARSFSRKVSRAIEEQAYRPRKFSRPKYIKMLGGLKGGPLEQKFPLGIGVTNYGLLDLPVSYDPFYVKKFYSGAARHWGDWLVLLHTATVGGKLFCCFCYEEPLLSKKTAKRIAQEFVSILL